MPGPSPESPLGQHPTPSTQIPGIPRQSHQLEAHHAELSPQVQGLESRGQATLPSCGSLPEPQGSSAHAAPVGPVKSTMGTDRRADPPAALVLKLWVHTHTRVSGGTHRRALGQAIRLHTDPRSGGPWHRRMSLTTGSRGSQARMRRAVRASASLQGRQPPSRL